MEGSADGQGLAAQSDAREEAPQRAGHPGKGGRQVRGGNAHMGRGLDREPESRGRASDAEGPARPEAKDASDSAGKRGRKMMNGVKRAHGWRVQEGKADG